MKKLISRVSLCTLLMFFATVFSCQLYMNDAEAALKEKDLGSTITCTLTDRKSDKTALVCINPTITPPAGKRFTYYVTISWSGGSWTEKIETRGSISNRSYKLGKDHSWYTIKVESPNGARGKFSVGANGGGFSAK